MADQIPFNPVSPATISPNWWYQVTELRDDQFQTTEFGSSLQVKDPKSGVLGVYAANSHFWQFQPIPGGFAPNRYALRSSATGIKKQLGVCYNIDEIADGKTQPCLQDSNGSEEQMWEVSEWGDAKKVYRFTNVKNGTGWWMDVHTGQDNPLFMSNDIDTNVYQPAQRWMMKGIRQVNDGGYSTDFTNIPSPETAAITTSSELVTTTASLTSLSDQASSTPPSSNDEGLSASKAAAIGAGAGLVVIIIALVAYFFWWRRRNNRTFTDLPGSANSTSVDLPYYSEKGAQEVSGEDSKVEMSADSPTQEMSAESPVQEMSADSPTQEMSGESVVRYELE